MVQSGGGCIQSVLSDHHFPWYSVYQLPYTGMARVSDTTHPTLCSTSPQYTILVVIKICMDHLIYHPGYVVCHPPEVLPPYQYRPPTAGNVMAKPLWNHCYYPPSLSTSSDHIRAVNVKFPKNRLFHSPGFVVYHPTPRSVHAVHAV